jgi:integrase
MPPADVFAAAKPKRQRKTRALDVDEARRFITAATAMDDDGQAKRRNGVGLVLALTVGLRPGELLALTWDDLDLDAGLVCVTKAWKGRGDSRHLGEPKTRGSRRTLAIPVELVSQLWAHRRRKVVGRMRSSRWADLDPGFVMGGRFGGPVDEANLRRLVTEVADDAGLGKLAPYDLRHSATSILSAAGVRNEELADLLGHVDTRMVERHYRHRLGGSIDVAAGPMAALLQTEQIQARASR